MLERDGRKTEKVEPPPPPKEKGDRKEKIKKQKVNGGGGCGPHQGNAIMLLGAYQ